MLHCQEFSGDRPVRTRLGTEQEGVQFRIGLKPRLRIAVRMDAEILEGRAHPPPKYLGPLIDQQRAVAKFLKRQGFPGEADGALPLLKLTPLTRPERRVQCLDVAEIP
eukprot:scaffold128587_cov69-Phaeocystis_antarctica.AAC.2